MGGKVVDLRGQQFSYLTVVRRATDEERSHLKANITYWYCTCNCGHERCKKYRIAGTSPLRKGEAKRCAPLERPDLRKDLSGKVFGRLTVLDSYNATGKRLYWNCICECGTKKKIRGHNLTSGQTKSCGCLHREVAFEKARNIPFRTEVCVVCGKEFETNNIQANTCSPECKKVRHAYTTRRWRLSNIRALITIKLWDARRRTVDCDLDHDYLLDLYNKHDGKCCRSGIPFQINLKEDGTAERNPWSASLDRIDSSIGYMKDNVQYVCLMYNLGKSTWTDEDVLTMAKALVENQNEYN